MNKKAGKMGDGTNQDRGRNTPGMHLPYGRSDSEARSGREGVSGTVGKLVARGRNKGRGSYRGEVGGRGEYKRGKRIESQARS